MKSLKLFKFVLLSIAIFSLSACELIEEPSFDETTGTGTESEGTYTED